ncbi:SigE family RNA polymerase sigma factor [Phytomonospora sp. NPDC050363]|uniref:SigE family RNA polymerase sigma factor n=1 Tax=Phytomonospora sp. NPDC050363 TaxID=3155642 RepID=UPI00341154B4
MDERRDAEFRRFVVERSERLRGFAYLCCGDWHRAEDAVQSALIRLYGAWNRAKRASLDPYVRKIIVNVLIDEHRLAWFRRVRVGDHNTPETPAAAVHDHTEERVVLVEALLKLPQRQRAVVVLRFWEDQSVEQTAEIMDCSHGAVKNLTMRGLAALRGLLSESALAELEGASR